MPCTLPFSRHPRTKRRTLQRDAADVAAVLEALERSADLVRRRRRAEDAAACCGAHGARAAGAAAAAAGWLQVGTRAVRRRRAAVRWRLLRRDRSRGRCCGRGRLFGGLMGRRWVCRLCVEVVAGSGPEAMTAAAHVLLRCLPPRADFSPSARLSRPQSRICCAERLLGLPHRGSCRAADELQSGGCNAAQRSAERSAHTVMTAAARAPRAQPPRAATLFALSPACAHTGSVSPCALTCCERAPQHLRDAGASSSGLLRPGSSSVRAAKVPQHAASRPESVSRERYGVSNVVYLCKL